MFILQSFMRAYTSKTVAIRYFKYRNYSDRIQPSENIAYDLLPFETYICVLILREYCHENEGKDLDTRTKWLKM